MRSIAIPSVILAAFLGAACNDSPTASKTEAPLAIPAGTDGRPVAPAAATAASTDGTWRMQLSNARVRYESLKAQASKSGQQLAASTDELLQKTKDALDAAEAKASKADEVAANEVGGFRESMNRDLVAIEADLRELDDKIAGEKSAAASRDVDQDHE